jgi:molybdopterin biosynthesis enzyme MoaB
MARVIEIDLPGFSEAMRMESYRITPFALISRAVCGIRGHSLIITLPGSPKAASECLSFVYKAIPHALEKLKGDPSDCAQ